MVVVLDVKAQKEKRRAGRESAREGGNESRGEDVALYASLLFFGGNTVRGQQRRLMHEPEWRKTHICEKDSRVPWLKALV